MSFQESYARLGALTLVEIDEDIWEVVLVNMVAMDWSVWIQAVEEALRLE